MSEIEKWLSEFNESAGEFEEFLLGYYYKYYTGLGLYDYVTNMKSPGLSNDTGLNGLRELTGNYLKYSEKFPYLQSLIIHATNSSSDFLIKTTSSFEKRAFI